MKKAMKIKVINRSAYALPQYETAGAAGMDVRADMLKIDPDRQANTTKKRRQGRVSLEV